jgi:hypothetical protein
LEETIKLLLENGVDGEVFATMNCNEFNGLGIKFGPSRKLALLIQKFKEDEDKQQMDDVPLTL